MEELIRIEKLTKVYESGASKVTAVKELSLAINAGDFVGIIGKSGCGKSTLLNLIGGIDTPTSGEILYKGKNLNDFKSSEKSVYRNKEIGFIFQSFFLENNFSVEMNVGLPLIIAGVSKKERAKLVENALRQVGLEDKLKNKPSQLSGGEKQRVAIARAIVKNPNLILADEPTGNLDTKTGLIIMEYLKAINMSGTTVILVTHNAEHSLYCKKNITMEDGEIIKIKEIAYEN